MSDNTAPQSAETSRRDFLKTSTATIAGTATLAAGLSTLAPAVYAQGSDLLKVGLVGCGGRGSGAASNALHGDANCELIAMADVFPDAIDNSLKSLKNDGEIAGRIKVKDDFKFTGLDAYKRIIDTCDIVVLASPPGFRPPHLRAAVEAGKHTFTEKPMATDPDGARSVFESVAISKTKKMALVAGFCWRYDYPRRELFKRIHDGEIGEVRAAYGSYLTGPVKPMPPASTRPAAMKDLEWQVRNWYNFTWLSGDGLVEQAVHTVDWLAWVFKDVPPLSATAVGGRQIPAEGGDIFDHVEVNYLYENDARAFLTQRQIPGCHNENNLSVLGTTGTAHISGRGVFISDLKGNTKWKYEGSKNNMYVTEHEEFFASIRSGKFINDGDRMAKSTLMGIMGRMAGYTGQQISWEQALNSKLKLVPDTSAGWDSKVEFAPIARPGITKFV